MLALSVIKDLLRNGRFALPGGYPMFFLTCDGEPISFAAVYAERRQVFLAHIRGDQRDQFALCGYDVNWEDREMVCCHTGKRIESAYAED
jgi:hypothetical protein